ncbi:integral membrane protein GPR180 [Engraulis encrasicolus]|uniref:integral membrane protein GPR180 n=1 Tax=Engraulis encrasicolus TaxID=184585 RepID=UPI002FD6BADD
MYTFATATVTFLLQCVFFVNGKTVSGVFRSDLARETNGQYITKFFYQAGDGLMVYRLENVPVAIQKEAKLLMFNDVQGFDNLSCLDRLSHAQLSISLSAEQHNQTVPQQVYPQAWHILYVDRYTCQESDTQAAPSEDLNFQIILMNPDSAGNPLDHFSAEEAGLHSFYFLLILAYFIASCIYMQPLWQALYKGGPMHTVLKVLTIALLLQGVSVLFNYIHMASYARDGVGTPLMGSLAEFCDMVAQVQMLYMLLSLCMGWTLSRSKKTQTKPLQWDSSPKSTSLAIGAVVTQGILLIWEQFEDTEHHSFHWQRSVPGLLLMLFRVALAVLLASVLYYITSAERSALKRDFYLHFAKGCCLWFLCHPALVLFSGIFNEHQQEKVVAIGVILCQSIAVIVLYQLFLSRSLYWEVSSLSSVTLPFSMSRTQRGRF